MTSNKKYNAISNEEVKRINNVLSSIRSFGLNDKWDERHKLLWKSADDIRQYLYSFEIAGSDSSFMKAYVDDALARFFHTIDLLSGSTSGKILEIGANPYLLTVLIKKIADFDLTLTNFFSLNIYDKDIGAGEQVLVSASFKEEYIFKYSALNIELSDYPYKSNLFDKILFCEVLEHVVVDPLKIFSKLHNILKPGGELILTTPNALRLINFAHMIAGKNFFDKYHPENGVYGRHNREYSISEVIKLLEAEGFKIKFSKTLDRYNYDLCDMYVDSYDDQIKLPWSGAQLKNILELIKGDTKDRGDNIYIVAERI